MAFGGSYRRRCRAVEFADISRKTLGFFVPLDDNGDVPTSVTKEVLREALKQQGVSLKNSETRKWMIEQARSVPGLLTGAIMRCCPHLKKLNTDWGEPVRTWAHRVHYLRSVGAA